jgi:hypothetical protein
LDQTPSRMPERIRQFKLRDGARMLGFLSALAAIFAASFFILPELQGLLVPAAPGGQMGPWVIRPILALHFGACGVAAAALTPLATAPLRRRWRAQDAAEGTRFDLFHNRPAARVVLYIKGTLLVGIYLISLVFYLLSWTVIGPDGVDEHLPWGVRHHALSSIASLTVIPDGFHVDSLAKNGPWYEVGFEEGRRVTFGEDNEGISKPELAAAAEFLASRSGRAWQIARDAHRCR